MVILYLAVMINVILNSSNIESPQPDTSHMCDHLKDYELIWKIAFPWIRPLISLEFLNWQRYHHIANCVAANSMLADLDRASDSLSRSVIPWGIASFGFDESYVVQIALVPSHQDEWSSVMELNALTKQLLRLSELSQQYITWKWDTLPLCWDRAIFGGHRNR
jgi:hypothetical protein